MPKNDETSTKSLIAAKVNDSPKYHRNLLEAGKRAAEKRRERKKAFVCKCFVELKVYFKKRMNTNKQE
jgi:hypothetical protein